MADSIVRLTVEDSSFNAKIKEAARSFADFGKNVASAGVEAFGKFAKGVETAKTAFQGFNQVLKANALVLVSSLAIQAASYLGEMLGNWITGANDAEDAQRGLNEELDRTAQLVKGILSESDFNARIAKAAGKSTSDILQMRYKAADEAYNTALSAFMNPNIKAGTEEYDKAKKIVDEAEKKRRKIWEDIQVDNTARANKTGEYAAKGGRGGASKPTYAADSIAAQSALVSELNKRINESGESVRKSLIPQLVEAESRLKSMKDEADLLKEQAAGRLLGGDVETSGLGSFSSGVPGIGKGLEKLPEHLSPLQQMNAELSRMKELLEMAPNTEAYQEALQKIIDKEKEIKQFKGESGESLEDGGKDISRSWNMAASAISEVGSELQNIDDPAAKIMATVAMAIANVAAAAGKAVSATDTTASGWAWIGAAAAITASMVSMISSIHSATGYAQGGIVGGNSYSGDNTLIRANAQEVVLTRAMAGNLASQLEGNGLGNLNLTATIYGEQIRLALNNNGRRTGRGEVVTTRLNV